MVSRLVSSLLSWSSKRILLGSGSLVNADGFLRCACPLDRFEALEVAHTLCDIVGYSHTNDIDWNVQ